MKILQELREQGNERDMSRLIDQIPYARFMGLHVDQIGSEVVTVLPFADHIIGNVNLPAVHGGALGAMLEITASLQLLHDLACESMPKTVDVSFDYLRSAGPVTTYGRAIVTRRGRRVAHVRSEIWQESRERPVAMSHGHYVLAPVGEVS